MLTRTCVHLVSELLYCFQDNVASSLPPFSLIGRKDLDHGERAQFLPLLCIAVLPSL